MENNKPSRQELLARAKAIREKKREIGRFGLGDCESLNQEAYKQVVITVTNKIHKEFAKKYGYSLPPLTGDEINEMIKLSVDSMLFDRKMKL